MTWYLHVRIHVSGDPWGEVRRTAIGPMSWTRARTLHASWESEFGEGTALVEDHQHPARRVMRPL